MQKKLSNELPRAKARGINGIIPQNQILTDSRVFSHTFSHLFPDSECILLSHPYFRTAPLCSRNIRLSTDSRPTVSLS